MKMLSVYVPESYIKHLDYLVKKGYFPNRNEAIRVAIRDLPEIKLFTGAQK